MKAFALSFSLLSCIVFSTKAQNIMLTTSMDTICAKTSTLLSVVGGFNLTFKWSPSIGLSDTFSRNVIASPTSNTTYTVTANDTATNWIGVVNNKAHITPHSFGYLGGLRSDGTLWILESQGGARQVGSDTDWASAAFGPDCSIGIKKNGTLWYWGDGLEGLAQNTSIPTRIGTDSIWSTAYANGEAGKYIGRYQNIIVLTKSGTAWAVGSNDFGELGTPGYTPTNRRVTVLTKMSAIHDNSWLKVSLGKFHSLGIKKNGTLWAWGKNYSPSPSQIGIDSNWVEIDCAITSVALKKDGTLWHWESGATPTKVGTNTTWVSIAAGNDNNYLALMRNGTLWSRGSTFGVLHSSLTQVGIGIVWKTISLGDYTGISEVLAINDKGEFYSPLVNGGELITPTPQTFTQKIVVQEIKPSFQVTNNNQCLRGNTFSFINTSTISDGTTQSLFWDLGNGSTSTIANPNLNYIASGDYNVKVIIISRIGCKDSATKSLKVHPMPIANFTINNAKQCHVNNQFVFNNTSSISLGSISNYNWQFGNGSTSNVESPSYSYPASGNYIVKLKTTSNNNCSDSVTRQVFIPNIKIQNLCLVTVDSATGKNTLIWERSDKLQHSGYKIYKETNVSNVYAQIGYIPVDSIGLFVDTNSNPKIKSDRYKIAAVDTCMSEMGKSNAHKTIHLTVSSGPGNSWNLNWQSYEGLVNNTVNIYRGSSLSSMSLLTSVQGSINSFTDFTAPLGVNYYFISIDFGVVCDPSVFYKTQYSKTTSNIVQNIQTGINAQDEIKQLQLFPNPTSGIFELQFETLAKEVNILVLDISGKEVYHSTSKHISGLFNQTIDLSFLEKGVYITNINAGERNRNVKLVVK